MAITDLWSDIVETLMPTVALAEEEPEEETPADDAEAEQDDGDDKEGDDKEDGGDDDDEEEEEEEDDDDEDEPEDPLPAVREEAAEGPCKEFKHHFEECVERVTKEQQEEGYADKDYKEDCVEEFFHLQHCIDHHVAPTFFQKHLK